MKYESAQGCLAERELMSDKIPACCFSASAFLVYSSVRSVGVAEKGIPVLPITKYPLTKSM